jgi:putative hydrolase of the HAD superfamily
MIPTHAILLDAVGTTIFPVREVSQTYAEFGRRHGSRLSQEEVALRFRRAFQKQEEQDRARGYRTSEERERKRWRTIVSAVFADISATSALFGELWEHFAQPSSWRVYPDAGEFVRLAARYRMPVVLASNFDARLRQIVAGLPELFPLHGLAISSEVGWKKPSQAFYHEARKLMGSAAGRIAVGDDFVNDYKGACQAGLLSFHLNRQGEVSDEFIGVRDLRELFDRIMVLTTNAGMND